MRTSGLSPVGACLTLSLLFLGVGCGNKYSNIPLYEKPVTAKAMVESAFAPPQSLAAVDAVCVPPAAWKMEPLKSSDDHHHQVWLSPSGNTAYGVIHFGLPLPVSAGWVLDPFLKEMKKSEGEANLIGQPMRDDSLPGIRFTVEGGLYKMRINLICRGWRGWAVYAGTLRTQPEVPEELELAEWAKDMTKVGVPSANGARSPAFIRQAAMPTD